MNKFLKRKKMQKQEQKSMTILNSKMLQKLIKKIYKIINLTHPGHV